MNPDPWRWMAEPLWSMAPGRRQSGRTGSVMLGGAAAGTGHRRERVGSFRLARNIPTDYIALTFRMSYYSLHRAGHAQFGGQDDTRWTLLSEWHIAIYSIF
uniref:Uncharacterized protein n=1 Tax=Triticum urartu TaxID=4572 RepID=A0A8R7UJP2_TRIUA